MGDSHALMLAPAFAQVASDLDLNLSASVMRYCPWLPGLAYLWSDTAHCYELQSRALHDVMEEVDPQLVVLVHRAMDDAVNPLSLVSLDHGTLDPGRDREDLVAEVLAAEVNRLRADGRRVLLVEPTPLPSPLESVLNCLSGADHLEECRRVAAVGPTPEEAVMRSLAEAHDDVWALDLDRLACPYLPICDPVVDGRVVMFDADHLGYDFALSLSDQIEQFLTANDVVDPLTR